MKRLTFKCTFLQDVILTAHSVSEGIPKTLDFIPGSNFLGIVAKKYLEFEQNKTAYNTFHSKKVRFGDAHFAIENKKSFKAPLCWFLNKGDSIENTKWVHHALTQSLREDLIKNNKQIKQIRKGWITNDGKYLTVETNFAIKSAYDRNERRSKEGQLYGYKSLAAGLELIFYVDIDTSIIDTSIENEKLIIDTLIGEKYIGRSRSAQYGNVKIEKIENNFISHSTKQLFEDKYLIIYAESRLAFFNDFGQMTLQPKLEDFNLSSNWEIAWDLCQINSQIYAPFNGKNRTYEADRVCFDKGSVFVFKKIGEGLFNIADIESGIGEYLNEGFGQVIVNPDFLMADEKAQSNFNIEKYTSKYADKMSVVQKDNSDELFLDWLDNEELQKKKEENIYRAVSEFSNKQKGKFRKISSSQWGQIRAIATYESDFNKMMKVLFDFVQPDSDGEIRSNNRVEAGFLERGKMKSIWKGKKDILKNELEKHKEYGTEYTVKLTAQMQKVKEGN